MAGGKRRAEQQQREQEERLEREEAQRRVELETRTDELRRQMGAVLDNESARLDRLGEHTDGLLEGSERFKKNSKKTSPSIWSQIGSGIANASRRFARWIASSWLASFFIKKEVEHRDTGADATNAYVAQEREDDFRQPAVQPHRRLSLDSQQDDFERVVMPSSPAYSPAADDASNVRPGTAGDKVREKYHGQAAAAQYTESRQARLAGLQDKSQGLLHGAQEFQRKTQGLAKQMGAPQDGADEEAPPKKKSGWRKFFS